jgi:23S rRNA (cytosine1962-C5)-methyltransferase
MQDQALDQIFWNARIENAVSLRQQLHLFSKKTGCRLINSEGDNLSGVIVDQYGPYLAVQVTALAMAERLDMICDSLERIVQPKGILLRGAERGLGKLEGLHLPDRLLRGEPPDGPIFVEEHGLRFGVDLTEGQKTGYYLDQRENRQAAARYAAGRRVLDMFCYSGGFGVASAVSGNASSVLSVDSSIKAISLARANAELNNALSKPMPSKSSRLLRKRMQSLAWSYLTHQSLPAVEHLPLTRFEHITELIVLALICLNLVGFW